jgi:hypothetical protein
MILEIVIIVMNNVLMLCVGFGYSLYFISKVVLK